MYGRVRRPKSSVLTPVEDFVMSWQKFYNFFPRASQSRKKRTVSLNVSRLSTGPLFTFIFSEIKSLD